MGVSILNISKTDSAALNAHKKDGYYAVRFPPADNSSEKPRWLLVGLNSERLKKNKKGENAQLNWLDMTLKNDKTPCVLAFSHGFFYGSGRYGHGSRTRKADMMPASRSLPCQR